MSMRRVVAVGWLGWMMAVTVLHGALNRGLFSRAARRGLDGSRPFRVGFLPVTCHLTCPVTHFINRSLSGGDLFEPVRFSGWPELKETYLAGDLEATFILAPLAMSLREQGEPIKIVDLGHRDGTTMMVRNDSAIFRIEDLKGRKIAVPNRFSNQRLIIYKALRERGMSIRDVTLLEMPPPGMPAALYARSVDAVISGEPFMAQSEMDGYGRVLFMTKDVWPDFISCVLAVPERIIRTRRADVQRLVDGIARSGKWLDRSPAHRIQAADFAGRQYYNQDPRLLRFVLSKPPDRVKYTHLSLVREDFEEIETLGREAGILDGTAHFDDYADVSFVHDETSIPPYDWEGPP
jgi:NitT/TauT family transport system substrate-binding protein